jgi:hypothetical protein
MPYPYGERIVLYRDGTEVADVLGGVDPYENRLVLDPDVDVAGGDIAVFRGLTRRVIGFPLRWVNPLTGWQAGIMAPVEPAPIVMPDLADIHRPNGQPVIDEASGDLIYPPGGLVWSGPCHIEPGIGEGTNVTDLATERISNLTSVATVPMTCINVAPDDLMTVTRSRDGRLLIISLVVIGVRINSDGFTRDLLVRDNQG